jgi:hypothetical protein
MAAKKTKPRTGPDAKARRRRVAAPDRPPAPELEGTEALSGTGDLPDTDDLGGTSDLRNTRSRRSVHTIVATALARERSVTGDDILTLAGKHIGEPYVLGARAPMANKGWRGPWDCAEFASWCVYQASGVLYGTQPRDDPMMADAFTGFWAQQAQAGGDLIGVDEAAAIAGAAVLRRPRSGAIGHIVLSDGRGGTVEAHSSKLGVIAGSLSGRRWDGGILVPGIRYLRADVAVSLKPPSANTIRLTHPLTRGDSVQAIQRRLQALGLAVGAVDGVFGPQTAHAVRIFQSANGLVADGEVGPATRAALGLK